MASTSLICPKNWFPKPSPLWASFTNPAYNFAVSETRRVSTERQGSPQAARFCAGCHDLVPFFGGRFEDPEFDGPSDPAGAAGITCTGCHAITHLNSVRGNADYTIEEPIHSPFAFSENRALGWINRQLVKAKPEFHKKTLLKPFHRTTDAPPPNGALTLDPQRRIRV